MGRAADGLVSISRYFKAPCHVTFLLPGTPSATDSLGHNPRKLGVIRPRLWYGTTLPSCLTQTQQEFIMTESFADRWVRDFEANHPEKARARYTTSSPLGSSLPSPACPARPRVATTSALPPSRSGEPWDAQTFSPTPRPAILPACQNAQAIVQAAIALRHDGGLTQAEFACRLGINVRTWQEWEQGRRLPSGVGHALLRQWVETHQSDGD